MYKIIDMLLVIVIAALLLISAKLINNSLYSYYNCFYFDRTKNVGEYAHELNCKYSDEECQWTCKSGRKYNYCHEK